MYYKRKYNLCQSFIRIDKSNKKVLDSFARELTLQGFITYLYSLKLKAGFPQLSGINPLPRTFCFIAS